MIQNRYFHILLVCLHCLVITAQPTDNTALYRSVNQNKYLRFYYDNDFFTATDQYYSQGINLELVHPGLKKFPLSVLLIHKKDCTVKYGLAIEHLAYTPSSIRHLEIFYGDRPFAACLALKTFAICCDTIKHSRISSTLSTGIIGKAAGGEWMQKTIHRNLNNIEPLGWDHQIKNDVLINYKVTYEKLFLAYKQSFSLSSYSEIALGTVRNNASAGIIVMSGHFDNPFRNLEEPLVPGKKSKKSQVKLYSKPIVNFIGYDATLQGGMFNHNSAYTISSKDITRITFEAEAGITLQYGKTYLEYFQNFITKEFSSGTYHRWGGIRIGVTL